MSQAWQLWSTGSSRWEKLVSKDSEALSRLNENEGQNRLVVSPKDGKVRWYRHQPCHPWAGLIHSFHRWRQWGPMRLNYLSNTWSLLAVRLGQEFKLPILSNVLLAIRCEFLSETSMDGAYEMPSSTSESQQWCFSTQLQIMLYWHHHACFLLWVDQAPLWKVRARGQPFHLTVGLSDDLFVRK